MNKKIGLYRVWTASFAVLVGVAIIVSLQGGLLGSWILSVSVFVNGILTCFIGQEMENRETAGEVVLYGKLMLCMGFILLVITALRSL